MNNKMMNRRQFIHTSGMVMLGSSALLMGCGEKKSNSSTPSTLPTQSRKRSLVFIMLDGGNDSFNMLVPTSNPHYQTYKTSRANLAIPHNELLPLHGFTDKKNQQFGLHPSLTKTQQLFADRKLSFVANIAPMIQPVTKSEFTSNSKPVPLGLMSHSDQFKHWQTAKPNERVNTGWFGGISDILQKSTNDESISMNISLAGSNIMQNGERSREYAITQKGSVGLKAKISNDPKTKALNKELLKGFESMLEAQRNDAFLDTYIDSVKHAQSQHEKFSTATSDIKIHTAYESTALSEQLKMVATSIAARNNLGMEQQTFFVRYIGWDHHSELLKNHANMLKVLDNALFSFQKSLEELGVEDEVITFTGSDFGRTLTSNGNGTDHGWGGNTIVMGTPINGSQVFGEYPSLSLGEDNALDIGNGVLIPTTSTDELFAELVFWLGLNKTQVSDVLPNLSNFYNIDETKLRSLGITKV